MFKELIIEKLKSMHIPFRLQGKEIKCACLNPEHEDHNPSFSINHLTGAFYCFSCGFKGNFKRYLGGELDPDLERTSKYLQVLRDLEEASSTEEDVEVFLPPNSGLPLESFRGLSKKTIEAKGLYYCNVGRYAGRIIFPVEPLGFDARIYPLDATKPQVPDAKYLRPVSFKTKQSMYICAPDTYSDTVIICEGVMDALSYMELGYHAAANFGLAECTPEKAGMLLAHGYTTVLNGLDGDLKGLEGWQRIKESFRKYFAIGAPNEVLKELRKSGFKDINDYLQKLKEPDGE